MAKNNKKANDVEKTGLYWPEKRSEVEKVILPFQTVETVNESKKDRDELALFRQKGEPAPGWRNKLIWGDNKYIMASLLPEFAGKINLIYIDPPFATGANFSINIKVGDLEWTKEASVIEEKAYRDTWGKGLDSYLQMMYDRLVLMRELLADNGSVYVHLDWHVGHYVKIIIDEIFGKENFQREISVSTGWALGFKTSANNWIRQHDIIMFYSKSPDSITFNRQYGEYPVDYTKRARSEPDGRLWVDQSLGKITQEKLERMKKENRVFQTKTGGWRKKQYLDEMPGVLLGDIWVDIQPINSQALENLRFPTQKPEALLERIITASSNEGDLVADLFCGSGTTGAVAEKLGRRWIMSDLSKFAIHTARKRLLDIEACKPFEVLNLGNYQKAKLKENGVVRYIDFILKLYRAESVSGYTSLHGQKAGRMVHIGAVDSIVTEREIRDTVKECASAGIKSVDFLGWDFEMGLHDLVDTIGDEYSVKIRLVQIPKEATEVRDAAKEDIRFFDLNFLEIEHKLSNKSLTISLKDFVISNPEYLPDEVREKIKNFTDYIDYWAVDFNFRDDTFHNMWQSFRMKKHPSLEKKCSYSYEDSGKYQVLVKVVDVFGNDTNKLFEVKI